MGNRRKGGQNASVSPTGKPRKEEENAKRLGLSFSVIPYLYRLPLSLHLIIALAFIIRMALLAFGFWQDSNFVVKYTDVDYEVFSDASNFIVNGESPYNRSTYRYTPILAILLLPNYYTQRLFGKLLFVFCDLLCGWLIFQIVTERLKKLGQGDELIQKVSSIAACVWLFNPFSINVSTRGNAESLIAACVLLFLYYLIKGNLYVAAIWFGISVHMKIYPIIYSLAVFLYINPSTYNRSTRVDDIEHYEQKNKKQLALYAALSKRFSLSIRFALVSASVFFLLTTILYFIYGYEFLYESYIYHIGRADHRHNFSLHFYQLYLSSSVGYLKSISSSILDSVVIPTLPFVSLVMQVLLLCTLSIIFYHDICFSLFVLTFVFVVYNKVCTVQYFIWYFSIIPLILPFSHLTFVQSLLLLITWIATQGIWFYFAYNLEFLGMNSFFSIWISAILFFFSNVFMLVFFITNRSNHLTWQIEKKEKE